MSSMVNWKRILRQLEVRGNGGPYPVTEKALAKFEQTTGRLSSSYRSYCRVFGPGMIGDWFRIAVPGYEGSIPSFSLTKLTETVVHNTGYKTSAPVSAEQIARGLFFGSDDSGAYYFFDPEDVPTKRPYEYAVYFLARNYEVSRLSDSFWQFVIQCCLGKQYAKLFPGSEPEPSFKPCSV